MDKVQPGHRPVTKTTSRFVSEAFSFLDENDLDPSNIKDCGLKDLENNGSNRNGENISNVNGVYTIVTSVQEKPTHNNGTKPVEKHESENVFRIVDFIGNKNGSGRYLNPVYVVEDELETDQTPTQHTVGAVTDINKDTREEMTQDKEDTHKETTQDKGQNGNERNSVIIEGEEVFLRKSPREPKSRSPRQQTWKNNQNVVSEAFGFLKDVPDFDDRLSSNIIDEPNNGSAIVTRGEHLKRSARQPTWKTNQRVVSDAFGFLREASDDEERLSSNSLGDSDETPQTQISDSTLSFPIDSAPIDRDSNQNTENENDIQSNQENSNQNYKTTQPINQPAIEPQSANQNRDILSANQSGEFLSANQSDSSVLSNQSTASDASSRASEELGELGGFKKSKFHPHHNRDEDGNSSDEDVGVYRESFRKSTWLYVGDKKKKGDKPEDYIAFSELGLNTCDTDSVFGDNTLLSVPESRLRNESTSTTVSEREFRNNFNSVSKRFVQRADSQQEYKRYTQAFYDNVSTYSIEKTDRDSFGIHILDSKPAVVSGVDAGSPAERAGLKEGQVVISVNGVNVLDKEHEDIIQLVHKDCANLTLEVGSGDLSPVLNRQIPVATGYMQKQVSTTIFRVWKKRYFILRRDNCLYYYKNEQDTDPLGAIPLHGYTVSRHGDPNKYAFKAEKYNCKTYFFLVDSRDDMTRWVGALNEAGQRQDERKDAWMEVTANNVGLPALDIRKPDCTGYLNTMGRATKRWRKRYCVLKDACIYYYKNSNSKEAEGVAHLHGYNVDRLGVSTKKYSFCLEPPEKQMRVFTFYAENETDKNRWIDALNSSIQKWIKVD